MVGDDEFIDDSEITTNAHIWGSCFRGNWGCRRDKKISEKSVKFFLGYFKDRRRDLSGSRLESGG